jgi:hypothetical protein
MSDVPRRDVAGDRHGVEVPGQRNASGPTRRRPRDDDVAVALDGERRVLAQRCLDEIREARLGTRHRLDVDQRGGQGRSGKAQIQHDRHATDRVR